jgi:hypothetical protein
MVGNISIGSNSLGSNSLSSKTGQVRTSGGDVASKNAQQKSRVKDARTCLPLSVTHHHLCTINITTWSVAVARWISQTAAT